MHQKITNLFVLALMIIGLLQISCANENKKPQTQQEATEIVEGEDTNQEQIILNETEQENENLVKNITEKKLTQDEIDAQEAKERGVNVEWWKKNKYRLEKDCQKVKDWTKEDIFNIPEARMAVAGLLKQYELLRLTPPNQLKKLNDYVNELYNENLELMFEEVEKEFELFELTE